MVAPERQEAEAAAAEVRPWLAALLAGLQAVSAAQRGGSNW
jgi:hypothetical protein